MTKVSNHGSDKTFHEKIPNELKTSVEDPIKTVIKRNLDTVNENANIVRKRLNILIHPDHPYDQRKQFLSTGKRLRKNEPFKNERFLTEN